MDLPNHGVVGGSLFNLLRERGNKPLTAAEAYRQLADIFKLTAQQRGLTLTTASGAENAWENRCRTARGHLVKVGAMNRFPRNQWALTDKTYADTHLTFEDLGL